MNDNKQQHNESSTLKDILAAKKLLQQIKVAPGRTAGEVFESVGLTEGSHSHIMYAILETHGLSDDAETVNALLDSMLIGIELGKRNTQ